MTPTTLITLAFGSSTIGYAMVLGIMMVTRPGRTLPPQCGMTKKASDHIHFCGEYGSHPKHICAICSESW